MRGSWLMVRPVVPFNALHADPFGIPAAFCYLLVRQRSAINPPSDKSLEDSKGTQYVVVSTPRGTHVVLVLYGGVDLRWALRI